MKKEIQTEQYAALRKMVEQRFGKRAVVTSDFAQLSDRIFEDTAMYLAPITLRRFWSEKECACYNVLPRRSTLNILSQFVGFSNWDSFIEGDQMIEADSSDFILKADLPASEVMPGSVIKLTWAPNRVLIIRYLGDCMFSVIESRNGKLSVGDTFYVETIVEGEPLLLTKLVHEGQSQLKYVCGNVDGIRYEVLDVE